MSKVKDKVEEKLHGNKNRDNDNEY
jgi:hypothetical protein